jgi:hypothetical protein
VVAAAGVARNPSGEATTFSALPTAPPIHAAGGKGNAEQAAPQAVSGSAHAAVSATFERMDTAAAPHVIESTPHRLAVGVDNAGLGWVEIHTSNTAGHVSATVAAGSAESHREIATQLPAMREFLTGEHVRVDSLASERFSASPDGQKGSSRDDGGDGSGRTTQNLKPDEGAGSSSADMDWEGMSYISVRV